MRKLKPEHFTALIFLSVITGIMLSVLFVFVSKKVKNAENPRHDVRIDWEKEYPFMNYVPGGGGYKVSSFFYDYVKEKLENYTSKELAGYYSYVESSKRYENFLGWNMAPMSEYNAVMKMPCGQLTTYTESRDVTYDALRTVSLSDFCRERGIDFFYINAPKKVCIHEDKEVSGILDFSNQNTDKFLDILGKNGVKYYDLRKTLHAEGMNHHGSFFPTDNHWTIETGFWASRHILKILKDDYGWPVNLGVLSREKFRFKTYREHFLGAYGKKVTLARAKPDDFTLITPKYSSSIRLSVPQSGIDAEGDFSVMLNYSALEPKDYYGKNTYGTYSMHSSVIRTENMNISEGKKFLLIRDSFSGCVLPFLALGVKYVDAVDLRSFSGSIRSYIEREKPDAVAVMYYAEMPGRTGAPYSSDTDRRLYDFR
ncbi:MAG: hypothetical protein IKQ95_07375 [Synergistaceae bacterium]|nr:hypothetical protein [Synergistaceae bacterium]